MPVQWSIHFLVGIFHISPSHSPLSFCPLSISHSLFSEQSQVYVLNVKMQRYSLAIVGPVRIELSLYNHLKTKNAERYFHSKFSFLFFFSSSFFSFLFHCFAGLTWFQLTKALTDEIQEKEIAVRQNCNQGINWIPTLECFKRGVPYYLKC